MQNFLQFLTEDKNTHLEHLEDDILNNGVAGGQNAIRFLESLLTMLQGHSRRSISITVKWDGRPAVFAGTNPENGKFFVGSKAIFNKDPKINYTNADIDRNHPTGPNAPLKAALKYLPPLGIPGVWQGDLLYTAGDLKSATIDGETHRMFKILSHSDAQKLKG